MRILQIGLRGTRILALKGALGNPLKPADVLAPSSFSTPQVCERRSIFIATVLTRAGVLSSVVALVAMILLAGMVGQAETHSLMTRHVREVTRNAEARLVGRLPATQIMHLVLVLPLSHQTELQDFLSDLYDPSSPSYRQFLTVEEFTARYGPSQEDYDAVLNFAEANGLAVVGTSRNRMNADVVGSVASIERTFQVNMGVYQHPTENRTFFAPDREPTVDLPFQLWHIAGLDSYSIPRPLYRRQTAHKKPHATTGSGPGASFLGSDMRAAYYVGPLTGSGQSLGLVEYYGTDLADLNTYYANAGQTNNVPITLLSTDGSSTSCLSSQGCDDTEQTLDMTQALGMAPGLSSLVMYVGSTDSAIFNAMATASPLNAQLSSSWTWSPSDPATDDPYFEEFAAQGQTLFQAAGDSSAWDSSSEIYPADDVYVTSVGGTDLETASAAGPWSSETVWVDGGGGISPDNFAIPSWQATAAAGCSSCSTTYRNGPDVSANANFTFYVCADQTTCTANEYGGTSFATPMWAGYLALANQQAVANGIPPLGFINPALYTLGLSSSYNTDFHDVASGSNGYSATTGYDLASGWGSPNGSGLINALAGNPGPGFFLSASPVSLTVVQGSSGTSTITSTATGGFDSPINLSASGQPTGVTVSFSPASISAAGTSTMTMTVGLSTATGIHTITVTGTSGSTTETITIFLTVTAPLTSIAVTPASATVLLPGTLQFTATGHYADGSTLNLTPTATWVSSNPAAATVSTSGVATGVAYGNANITASFDGITSNTAVLTLVTPPAIPTFSPGSGTYNTPQTVTMSDATPGVTTYYTTNGSTPTTSSPKYTGPITISTNTTLEAIAAINTVSGYSTSSVAFGVYQITALTPTFSPGSGTYNTPQAVTMSDATPGVTIYYTTNGSTPTTSSPVYTAPITISTNTTLEAIAAGNGYGASHEAFGVYQITALTPTFSPGSGTYNTPQTVTMSDTTPGVTIYYTTDGSTPTTSSTKYTAPITIAASTTLHAIAAGNGYGASYEAFGVYQIAAPAPSFSPKPGTYSGSQSVSISDSSPGLTIYYTTNGSTPTTSSPVYTGLITISTNTTLEAIAAGNGYVASSVSSGVYQFATAATPTFSPTPGSYSGPQSVSISDSSPGVTIYYTTDGSTPTTSSPVYAGPITIATTITLHAIASGNGYPPSSVGGGVYTITTATPTFSPGSGTYNTPQAVKISDATPGVTIYYTTNGSTPTTSSPVYTGPITIPTNTTLEAIAAGNGYGASHEAFGVYQITALIPSFSPGSGTYNTPQAVTLSDATPGVTIYYTTDGSTPTTSSPVYTGPITISTNTRLGAIAAGNGYGASSEAFGVYQITALIPSFSPGSGTYNTPQAVTISDATPGVTIYCTTDGSTPTTSSPQYTGPITVSTSSTLHAIAAGNGYGASSEAFGVYQITALVPSFSPGSGTYNTPQAVTMSDATPGVTIYYTTDGSTPTTSSPKYAGPITISTNTTLHAIAAGNGYGASSEAFGTYVID
jgi:subtilase family serine protease